MSKADQQTIAKYFAKKPVLYIGGLGQVFGIQAGVLLSQLLYWDGKGKRSDGFIYKTEAEVMAELGLTRTQQQNAINKLRNCGIIEYKLAQVPARRHFKVNMQRIHEVLPSLKQTCNLNYPNPPNYYVSNGETITKITRENTSENTRRKIGKNNFRLERNKLIQKMSVKPP